jgi:rhodanese-related sulfurtransferase
MNLFKRLFSRFNSASHAVPGVAAQEAAKRIADGSAVLVDVREPSEWESGVAEPANLLPLSDLVGKRQMWAPFLARHKDRELILYCLSGGRSGSAARVLAGEGHRVANLGGFSAWRGAKLPVRKP